MMNDRFSEMLDPPYRLNGTQRLAATSLFGAPVVGGVFVLTAPFIERIGWTLTQLPQPLRRFLGKREHRLTNSFGFQRWLHDLAEIVTKVASIGIASHR